MRTFDLFIAPILTRSASEGVRGISPSLAFRVGRRRPSDFPEQEEFRNGQSLQRAAGDCNSWQRPLTTWRDDSRNQNEMKAERLGAEESSCPAASERMSRATPGDCSTEKNIKLRRRWAIRSVHKGISPPSHYPPISFFKMVNGKTILTARIRLIRGHSRNLYY